MLRPKQLNYILYLCLSCLKVSYITYTQSHMHSAHLTNKDRKLRGRIHNPKMESC